MDEQLLRRREDVLNILEHSDGSSAGVSETTLMFWCAAGRTARKEAAVATSRYEVGESEWGEVAQGGRFQEATSFPGVSSKHEGTVDAPRMTAGWKAPDTPGKS